MTLSVSLSVCCQPPPPVSSLLGIMSIIATRHPFLFSKLFADFLFFTPPPCCCNENIAFASKSALPSPFLAFKHFLFNRFHYQTSDLKLGYDWKSCSFLGPMILSCLLLSFHLVSAQTQLLLCDSNTHTGKEDVSKNACLFMEQSLVSWCNGEIKFFFGQVKNGFKVFILTQKNWKHVKSGNLFTIYHAE